jgi:hypothetical protein
MARRLNVPNDRQDVGCKLSRLGLKSHTHPLHGAGWIRPSRFPRALAAARAIYAHTSGDARLLAEHRRNSRSFIRLAGRCDIAALGKSGRDLPQGDRPTIWIGRAQLAGRLHHLGARFVAVGALLPRQHTHHLGRIPCATACRWYPSLIQPYRNSPQRRCAGGLQFGDDRR